ncbi:MULTISPECIES: hypothetical protein [Methanoculleus]|uniref:hypothetical protein n=1 Tax=Methanoculleus TaxID=45989 RepID=UPI000AC0F58E|nr:MULTISPECIES: hypothetical protein [Methanoculleus]NLN09359.1 hypothetical protein [Methanoculleus thermophilus]HQD25243.1 hypothetical protein [Methanoculleus thermophilus]
MERSTFSTFACLAERAARYPTIIRRSQMRKTVFLAATTLPSHPSCKARGYT